MKDMVQDQMRLRVTLMQHISPPLIIMQGRNKKGSNLVTHDYRVTWYGTTFQPGEDAVSCIIQTTFNKCPIIVQEYLASDS